ncbi:hypothetical protein LAD12857_17320 [Lacrimispora amygdalina]|uniref:Uncharacterized protein n=1 Tax=Lacrimispora amygdalina TaxID=253257 RepID=A0ABQ5M5D3_9FIRM
MTTMLANIISCFIDSNGLDVLTIKDEAIKYRKYSYYTPSLIIINVKNETENNGLFFQKKIVFKNLTKWY